MRPSDRSMNFLAKCTRLSAEAEADAKEASGECHTLSPRPIQWLRIKKWKRTHTHTRNKSKCKTIFLDDGVQWSIADACQCSSACLQSYGMMKLLALVPLLLRASVLVCSQHLARYKLLFTIHILNRAINFNISQLPVFFSPIIFK